jgi:5-methylcytosine-specific restriction protein B
MAQNFVEIATNQTTEFSDIRQLSDELLQFFENLSEVGSEFGYRTANEISRFASLAEQLADDWKFNDIMDAAIAQKLLPKLHGSRRKLEKVLFKLGQLCIKEGDAEELLKKPESINWDSVKYPISFEKIVRMHKGLVENGFTSFAEA